MTKRLNDDLDCLWRKVQGLEREVDRLKQEHSIKTNGSPPLQSGSNVQEQKPSPSNYTADEGGVEVSQMGAFLSSDKKTISANILLYNNNTDDVFVMAVGVESSFNIPNTINKSSISVDGIKDCTAHAGMRQVHGFA
jgi:hypothetical protein